MTFSLKEHVFGGRTFCCCLPLRLGVVIISFVSLLLSGFLSVILWYEVRVTSTMSGSERAVFAGAGVVESLLCVASILGFVGAIVKKQSFIIVYVYFLYFHLVINCAVAGYFLYMIVHAANTDIVKACKEGLRSDQAKDQCDGLLKFAKWVYFAVASTVLLVEMYTTIVVTRYYRFLRTHKRDKRQSRMSLVPNRNRYTNISTQSGDGLLDKEFDPYAPYGGRPQSHYDDNDGSDSEEGYGGGAWNLQQFATRDKDRLSTIGERTEVDVDSLRSTARDRMSPPPRTTTPATLASRRASLGPSSPTHAQMNLPTVRALPIPPSRDTARDPSEDSPPMYDSATLPEGSVTDRKTRP
ncbi:hypothetical protein PUNSTDRAFT_118791 [Punctularia strigosozonata HHB-11173 SS5]|uniref:uncharacterized protein n=1 Tax=Punctularia strigosozonata (strain HHB-11173) TaxID=741275 RepID=UPI0004417F57|nr:uncharacterized protein PUNSTDRAFT_118791 [Punctularia strigosozonata HHB-11173 SS5]EIN11330.1 hypothetical protein PUNSTDRAFT_118791 [Punctularia strigosozonata HHB-11173 SS5]